MNKRKYKLYCDLRVPKRFFFWGIFRNKNRLEEYVRYKTSLFIDGTFEMNGKVAKGKIVEFDVSDTDFYCILGRLAIIEAYNYILIHRYNYAFSKTGKEYDVIVYVYAESKRHIGYY